MKLFSFLLIIYILFSSSCSKEKKYCKEFNNNPMKMEAPESVYERTQLTLKVLNGFDMGVNGHYGWTFPDMTLYPITTGGAFEVDKANTTWAINNVKIQDEGTYTFSASNTECGKFMANRYVKILPLPIPCLDEIEQNKLYVLDSATGILDVVDYTVDLHDGSNAIYLSIEAPIFTYDLIVEFDYLPERASTFYLRNFYENGIEAQVPQDKLTQASIAFIPDVSTATTYKLIPFTEDIYVRRNGNQITLTLCNVRFKAFAGVKYVSTKLVFDL